MNDIYKKCGFPEAYIQQNEISGELDQLVEHAIARAGIADSLSLGFVDRCRLCRGKM